MLNAKDARKRLLAAQALLLEPSTTQEKFTSVRTLVAGIHPKIDQALANCDHALSTVGKVESGDIVGLSAEHLPENTEEQKKRKKWLLLFINSWRKLGSEVERVQAELAAADNAQTGSDRASHWGRIFNFAKGPFGIITIVAVGAVIAMQATAVTIVIKNNGCETLYPSSSIPISMPGLKLPRDPIPSGSSAEVVIPGLTVTVDGSQRGVVSLSMLNYSIGIQLPANTRDVTLNGISLLGKKTRVPLSERDQHTLVLSCS